MNIFKKMYIDIRRYREYFFYTVKSNLKANLSGSYLGYFWWLLDPLMFMLVYVFVVCIIFGRGGPDYPIFVFSGLLSWKWTSTSISQCSGSIRSKAGILKQVYLPKFLLPLINTTVNSIYYLFGLIVLFIMVPLYKIDFSWHILEFVFVFIVQFLFLYGLGLLLSHVGVYVSDLKNILSFSIRFWFYMSPVLYDINSLPEKYIRIFYINPMTTLFESYRNVFMYSKSPDYLMLGVWTVISIILIFWGLKVFEKYDRTYTKVI